MRKFLQMFVIKGLRMYKGENMVLASKELMAICRRFYEAREFPVETPLDILTGLSFCSVPDFQSMFEHRLQTEKCAALAHSSRPSQEEAFNKVVDIVATAVMYYDSLNVSTSWVLPCN